MLEVGNSGISDSEGRSHFALWCLMKAPLLIGTDITAASAATLSTLSAPEVIGVNQDAAGQQGTLKDQQANFSQTWSGGLSGGCVALLVINLQDGAAAHVSVQWAQIGIAAGARVTVRDLWARKNLPEATGGLTVTVSLPHDNVMLKLCPANI